MIHFQSWIANSYSINLISHHEHILHSCISPKAYKKAMKPPNMESTKISFFAASSPGGDNYQNTHSPACWWVFWRSFIFYEMNKNNHMFSEVFSAQLYHKCLSNIKQRCSKLSFLLKIIPLSFLELKSTYLIVLCPPRRTLNVTLLMGLEKCIEILWYV